MTHAYNQALTATVTVVRGMLWSTGMEANTNTCSAVVTVHDEGYEHMSPLDRPLRTRACGAPATVRVRYGRARWTLAVCDAHVARHTDHGAVINRGED